MTRYVADKPLHSTVQCHNARNLNQSTIHYVGVALGCPQNWEYSGFFWNIQFVVPVFLKIRKFDFFKPETGSANLAFFLDLRKNWIHQIYTSSRVFERLKPQMTISKEGCLAQNYVLLTFYE